MILPTGIRNNTILHIFALLVLGVVLVFFDFMNIPKYMTFDEIEFSKLALSLDKAGYIPYSSYATGHATLYFYTILISFKLLGIGKLALRLPSAIYGILNPVLLYLILRQFFTMFKGKTAGFWPFLISLLFLTSRWYFNFARFGFEATFLILLEFLSLLFVLMFINSKRALFIVLSGVFSGLAYNSYQPGRLFFLIPLLVLFFDGFHFQRLSTLFRDAFKHKMKIWKTIALFLIPFAITITPLTVYLAQHPDIRMYQLFYPGNHETSLAVKFGWFAEDVWKTFSMFFFKGDMNGRHNYTGKPALNPFMGIMFVTGLIVAWKKRKQFPSAIFFFWLVLSLIPTLLTYPWENPNMLRTITVTPAVAFFSGVALMEIYGKIRVIRLPWKTAATVCLYLLVMTSVIYEIRTYFLYQSRVFLESFEAKRELIYYIDHPDTSVFEP